MATDSIQANYPIYILGTKTKTGLTSISMSYIVFVVSNTLTLITDTLCLFLHVARPFKQAHGQLTTHGRTNWTLHSVQIACA